MFLFWKANPEFKFRVLKIALILLAAVSGDILVQFSSPYSLLLKCFFDSGTHFCIAILSWIFIDELTLLTIIKHPTYLVVCGFLASLIDMDHFFAAQSFNIHVSYFLC